MTRARLLMVLRILLGLLLLRQGAIGMSDLPHLARVVETHDAWQAWPLVGGLRPMAVALWIAGGQFAAGMFLTAGLLTRLMAAWAALLTLFALGTLWDLGLAPNLAHALLLIGCLVVMLKGGGAATMDHLLGAMQQRSIEREAERESARSSAGQSAAPAAEPPSRVFRNP